MKKKKEKEQSYILLLAQENYATYDSSGMCHMMPQ